MPAEVHEPDSYARGLAQQSKWSQDGAIVELRPLKYKHQFDAAERPVLDIKGNKIAKGAGREKGIDVLVALACVREAHKDDIDVVILASRDTDLQPVLDEIYDLREHDPSIATVETLAWHDRNAIHNYGALEATRPRRIWNTNLDRARFEASRDRTNY